MRDLGKYTDRLEKLGYWAGYSHFQETIEKLRTASAEHRSAFEAGYNAVNTDADCDLEKAWQQYRCKDDSGFSAVSGTQECLIKHPNADNVPYMAVDSRQCEHEWILAATESEQHLVGTCGECGAIRADSRRTPHHPDCPAMFMIPNHCTCGAHAVEKGQES